MPMTPQEIFDKVAIHLLTQNCKSVSDEFAGSDLQAYDCYYRGANSTKCAIGCLIPDDLYSPDMEGKRVSAILVDFQEISNLLMAPGAIAVNFYFLGRLQAIHDKFPVAEWPYALAKFATEHKLTLPYQLSVKLKELDHAVK